MANFGVWGWLALAVVWVGCGVGQDGDDRHVRNVSALDVDDGGWVAIDLTDPDLVVYFDHTQGPIDYARISLTCPNGQGMPLDFWLEFEGRRLNRPADLIGERMMLVAGDRAGQEEQEDREGDSCWDCHLCPDGLTICEYLCGDGQGRPPQNCSWLGCEDPSADPGSFADTNPQPDWADLWGVEWPQSDDGSGEQDEPRSGSSGGFADGDDDDDDDSDDDDGGGSGGWDSGYSSGWGSGSGSSGGSGGDGGGHW